MDEMNLIELNDAVSGTGQDGDISRKYLTFNVAGQRYGMPIYNVIEIVQVPPMTPMPELPYYAKGIINLRGRVIPVIDINLRFGKPEQEYTDRTCVVIVDLDDIFVGFVVESVEEVLDIDGSRIAPPPSFADGGNRFVIGIGKMDGYLVLLIDTRLLLPESDISLLSMDGVS